MTNTQVLRGWSWILVALMAGMLILPMFGCASIIPDLSKAAGYTAPADFTKGVGETVFFQSTDGKTIFWEIPYFNDTPNMAYYHAEPTITIKDEDGKIVWLGSSPKDWKAKPGEQGRVGGKIVIPDAALKPTLKWERGNVASCGAKGQAATK